MNLIPKVFLFDVDGVLCEGGFLYDSQGKAYKKFGPDDHDALLLLSRYMEIQFISGDKRGFPISEARIVKDMKMPLTLVSTTERIDWIKQKWDPKEVVYMGDGIFDNYVFREVGYAISPGNGDDYLMTKADYVTKRFGGDRAVSEACLHVLAKFFDVHCRENILPGKKETSL
ncbi:phosphatase [Thalassomonas viridans]|uniref:Phosphatase n=1 Tax=Thalassomonas viridans TaxID=137584 RepID=A0AAE9ZAR5_9GAMM|nr:phosphatase [Thalassomonas viridans]WDE09232.1 phosphatase [Thalassomonas viridans]